MANGRRIVVDLRQLAKWTAGSFSEKSKVLAFFKRSFVSAVGRLSNAICNRKRQDYSLRPLHFFLYAVTLIPQLLIFDDKRPGASTKFVLHIISFIR
jgi:hypothetical protein